MISRNRGLEHGKGFGRAHLAYAKDRPAAVPDVHRSVLSKCYPGRDPNICRENYSLLILVYPANLSVGTVRDKKFAVTVKRQTCRVHYLGRHLVDESVRFET